MRFAEVQPLVRGLLGRQIREELPHQGLFCFIALQIITRSFDHHAEARKRSAGRSVRLLLDALASSTILGTLLLTAQETCHVEEVALIVKGKVLCPEHQTQPPYQARIKHSDIHFAANKFVTGSPCMGYNQITVFFVIHGSSAISIQPLNPPTDELL